MPTPALFLISFMDRVKAVEYLRKAVHLKDSSDRALKAVWSEAKSRASPIPLSAGQPEVLPLEAGHEAHLDQVQRYPRFPLVVTHLPWQFALIEIDPILALQPVVFTEKVDRLRAAYDVDPCMANALGICLPPTPGPIKTDLQVTPGRAILRTDEADLRLLDEFLALTDGTTDKTVCGPALAPGNPLVQVGRFDGRCYLKNGYHRACALRRAGATHMPCVLIELENYTQMEVNPRNIFGKMLIDTAKPTCSQFADGGAYPLTLRSIKKVVEITWRETMTIE